MNIDFEKISQLTPFLLTVFIILTIVFNLDKIKTLWFAGISIFKFGRKKIIASETKLPINDFLKKVNGHDRSLNLPYCEVNFVNSKNIESYLKNGKTIIKLSYSKDKSIYSAIKLYTENSILPEAIHHFNKNTSEALKMTLIFKFISNFNQRFMKFFNNDYHDNISNLQSSQYKKIVEIDENNLFDNFLFPELKQLGQLVKFKPPTEKIKEEADDFIDYLYNIVVRERNAGSKLCFWGRFVKVGVILIAKDLIYEKYGKKAYIKRIYDYKIKKYNKVCLLAHDYFSNKPNKINKAFHRNICLSVVRSFTKENIFTYYTIQNKFMLSPNRLLTCIVLNLKEGDYPALINDKLKQHFINNEPITATITNIAHEHLDVAFMGNTFLIPKKELSELDIVSLYEYFKINNELLLKVLKKNGTYYFSNIGSITDPNHDIQKAIGNSYVATIERVKRNGKNQLNYLQVTIQSLHNKGFIPTNLYQYGHIQADDIKLKEGNTLNIIPLSFDTIYSKYICKNQDYQNPWEMYSGDTVAINTIYDCIIDKVKKFQIEVTLSNGMTCIIYSHEYSWFYNKKHKYSVGSHVNVKILKIDRKNEYLYGSIR